MDTNWVRIYKTPDLYKAKVVEALLSENEIACQIMNKQDSMFVLGSIEVYVPEPLQDAALILMDENEVELNN